MWLPTYLTNSNNVSLGSVGLPPSGCLSVLRHMRCEKVREVRWVSRQEEEEEEEEGGRYNCFNCLGRKRERERGRERERERERELGVMRSAAGSLGKFALLPIRAQRTEISKHVLVVARERDKISQSFSFAY